MNASEDVGNGDVVSDAARTDEGASWWEGGGEWVVTRLIKTRIQS